MIYSPFSIILLELDLSNAWGLGLVAIAVWSFAPDFDLTLPVSHRCPTHSVTFAILAGVLTAVFSGYFVYDAGLGGATITTYAFADAFGFTFGFLGVVGHIVGDSFMKMGVSPWWPWTNKWMVYRAIYAANERVSQGLGTMGALALTASAVAAPLW